MAAKRVTIVETKKRPMLAERDVVGREPCPGEAHDPAVGGMIDHCGLCAPEWGTVRKYAPTSVGGETKAGKAVPRNWKTQETDEELKAMTEAGTIKLVEVKDVRPGATHYYMAWVKG